MQTDKFHMSLQDNIFFAKRNLIDSIYKEAIVEGINVTFPQTEAVLEGIVEDISQQDITKILNLKRAWYFILDSIEYGPINLSYLRTLNGLIENNLTYTAGNIRNFGVGISGTAWIPAIPTLEKIEEDIKDAYSENCDTDRSLMLMLKIMRGQYFEDGNKRTAQLAANHELIRHGRGIVAVPPEKKKNFSQLLVEYYETDSNTKIMDFLYHDCLQGFVREKAEAPFDFEKAAMEFVKTK